MRIYFVTILFCGFVLAVVRCTSVPEPVLSSDTSETAPTEIESVILEIVKLDRDLQSKRLSGDARVEIKPVQSKAETYIKCDFFVSIQFEGDADIWFKQIPSLSQINLGAPEKKKSENIEYTISFSKVMQYQFMKFAGALTKPSNKIGKFRFSDLMGTYRAKNAKDDSFNALVNDKGLAFIIEQGKAQKENLKMELVPRIDEESEQSKNKLKELCTNLVDSDLVHK